MCLFPIEAILIFCLDSCISFSKHDYIFLKTIKSVSNEHSSDSKSNSDSKIDFESESKYDSDFKCQPLNLYKEEEEY